MSTTDTEVSNLIVNKLTLSKYKELKTAGTLSETESYEITDIDTAIETGSADAANRSLSNLNSTGQAVLDDKLNTAQITNCITEISQDIKLELNDDTITLKAGSKVYVPNGAGIFDEVTISSDFSITSTTNVQEFILLSPSRTSITHFNKNLCSSGSTQPTVTTTYWMWYDTANNKIKFTTDNGVSWVEGFSLPLGLSTSTSSGITSIDQVFNGFGYFGKRNFITNVKLLIAKGYNTDGTYHNQEYIINSPIISLNDFVDNSIMFFREAYGGHQIYNIKNQYYLGELNYVPDIIAHFQWYYNTINRMWYMHEAEEQSWRQVDYANLGINTSTETNFKEIFRVVDYNDLATDLENRADINLSNLTSQGKNIANWSTNITNCITEIPQDIKLELNNGIVTLKAGSKIHVPNGVGVFDVVTVPSDVIFHSGTIGTATMNMMLCCNLTGGYGVRADPDYFISGATAPTNTSQFWYDTTNNAIKKYENGSWVRAYSLPIGIYHRENGNAVSIDQVFNGFGYIGSTVFALPGVKGLIPNGRNADGSLKNVEYNRTSVRVDTFSISSYTGPFNLYCFQFYSTFQAKNYYDEKTNTMLNNYNGSFISGNGYLTNGKITSFTSKTVFCIPEYQKENINVKDFGAKGDGTTDDTEAFTQAINASPKGGTIIVPFGNYKLSSNPDDNTKNLNWDIANGTNFSGVAGQTAVDNNYKSFSTPYLTNPYIKAGGYKERVGLDILSPVGGGVCATIYELEGRPYSETTITGTITSGSAVMTNVSGNLSAIHKGNIIHSTISGWPDSNNRGTAMRVVSVDENTNTITFGNTPETKAIPGDGWVKATPWKGATQTTTFTIRPRNWQVLHYDGVTTGTVDNVDDFYYCFNSVMNITGTNGHLAEYDLNLLNETRDFSIGLLLTGIGDKAAPCKGIEINRGGGQNWTTGIDIKNCQYGIGITAYQPILIRTNFYDNISKQNLISLNGIMFDNFTDLNNMFRPILGAGQLFDNTTCIALSRYSDSNPTGYFFRGRTKTNLTDIITMGVNGDIVTTGAIYAKDYRIGQTLFTQTVNCNKTITLFDKDNNPFYVPCYQNV